MKPVGTSIIFVNGSRQILLILRDQKSSIPFPNCWDLPGGHLENDESPEVCIMREMKEELNIKIEPPHLFRTYDMGDRIEHTFWLFVESDLSKLPVMEGQRSRWFTHGEISEMRDDIVAFGFRQVMLEFFHERPFANR